MDFHLPEELQMLKDNLRRFVDNELIPIERKTNDGTEFFRVFKRNSKKRPEVWGSGCLMYPKNMEV